MTPLFIPGAMYTHLLGGQVLTYLSSNPDGWILRFVIMSGASRGRQVAVRTYGMFTANLSPFDPLSHLHLLFPDHVLERVVV